MLPNPSDPRGELQKESGLSVHRRLAPGLTASGHAVAQPLAPAATGETRKEPVGAPRPPAATAPPRSERWFRRLGPRKRYRPPRERSTREPPRHTHRSPVRRFRKRITSFCAATAARGAQQGRASPNRSLSPRAGARSPPRSGLGLRRAPARPHPTWDPAPALTALQPAACASARFSGIAAAAGSDAAFSCGSALMPRPCPRRLGALRDDGGAADAAAGPAPSWAPRPAAAGASGGRGWSRSAGEERRAAGSAARSGRGAPEAARLPPGAPGRWRREAFSRPRPPEAPPRRLRPGIASERAPRRAGSASSPRDGALLPCSGASACRKSWVHALGPAMALLGLALRLTPKESLLRPVRSHELRTCRRTTSMTTMFSPSPKRQEKLRES